MKQRFEEALRKRMMGATSVLELGLELRDLFWGADKARAFHDNDKEFRFRTAATRLQTALTQK